MSGTINRLEGITMQAEQNSQDTAVGRFNEYWQSVGTSEARARRDAERAEYEERYEAMMARKRAEVGPVIGTRHVRDDGRECFCGCHFVVGLVGEVVQDADTAKLAELGLMYVRFTTEHHGEVTVCYDLPRAS